jgi:glycosyltransferase involved in cell wall biosynthesis
MKRARPDLEVSLYGSPTSFDRDAVAELRAAGIGIRVVTLFEGMNWYAQPFPARAIHRIRQIAGGTPQRAEYVRRAFEREIHGADLLYFPWPYFVQVPRLRSPMVATIHDLNFKYFFGTPVFTSNQKLALDQQMQQWTQSAQIVASSQFMADEIRRFYPGVGTVPVSGLAPFSDATAESDHSHALPTGVRRPYILSANNVTVHKNLGAVIAAHAILRERNPKVQLVMAGVGTERATGRATSVGSTSPLGEPDVIGLGYVSDGEILQLIDQAEVVVNASLYEAGNGPGLDAWSRGTPVAMSDIASFTEHLLALGVEAALFNPRDPLDIAIKLQAVLGNPGTAHEVAERSQVAIRKHTWEAIAARYLDVFDAAFARGISA